MRVLSLLLLLLVYSGLESLRVKRTLLASFLLSSSAMASLSCLWKFHGGILTVSTISTSTNMMQPVLTPSHTHTQIYRHTTCGPTTCLSCQSDARTSRLFFRTAFTVFSPLQMTAERKHIDNYCQCSKRRYKCINLKQSVRQPCFMSPCEYLRQCAFTTCRNT